MTPPRVERWWLDYVPRCMRSWPFIRRYFWQQWEIDAAKAKAQALRKLFGDK